MGTLVFQATLGGSVNLIGPNIAGTVNFTLPSADGTSGQALATNGSGTLAFSSFATLVSNTFTGSQTLSAGTANGVTYLNGSKVLTSGSALTFDGTNFATTGTSSGSRVIATSTSTSVIHFDTSASVYGKVGNSTSMGYEAGAQHIFNISGTEGMRLTSTGLGIGTSSPSTKLEVQGNTPTIKVLATNLSGATTSLELWGSGGGANYKSAVIQGINYGQLNLQTPSGVGSNSFITFATDATERMRLDSSGNLGLGVTPSAWSAYRAFQFGQQGVIFGDAGGGTSALGSNQYWNGSNWIRIAADAASQYKQAGGAHAWYYAASSTAGSTISFTQAMTLQASGGLSLGVTTDAGAGNIQLGSGAYVGTGIGTGNTTGTYYGTNEVRFYTSAAERARIDSSGRFLIKATTSGGLGITLDGDGGSAPYVIVNSNSATGAPAYFRYQGTTVGSITTTTTTTSYNITSDQRLKENIVDAPEFGSVIDSLKVRSFDWKADSTHQRAGFVAQELVTFAPEAVHQPVDTEEMMAVDYSKLVPMLVKEIQSLRTRVAQLETN